MAWPVTSFEDVDFLDGSGWLTVAAIHRGIKERAECAIHAALTGGDYGAEFDGVIWTQEPWGDGKLYLLDWLGTVYTDLTALVEGVAGIRWTTTSNGDTLWTMADLETDIGMGAYLDLITDVTDPRPFIWLQAALDRLIYLRRLKANIGDSSPTSTVDYYFRTGDDPSSASSAYSEAIADSDETDPAFVNPIINAGVSYSGTYPSGTYNAAIGTRAEGAIFTPGYSNFTQGTQVGARWEIKPESVANCTLAEVDIYVNDDDPVTVPLDETSFISADVADVPMTGGMTGLSIAFDTIPASLPFNGTAQSGFVTGIGTFTVRLYRAWICLDIAGELEDQA